MNCKCNSLAASLDAGGTCNDYGFVDSFDGGSGGLVGCPLQPAGAGGFSSLPPESILNTFTFDSEKKLFYRFVGQKRYRLVTDTVFENRLSGGGFAIKNRPTSFSLFCRSCRSPMRPILNYHSYSESLFCRSCRSKTDSVIGGFC